MTYRGKKLSRGQWRNSQKKMEKVEKKPDMAESLIPPTLQITVNQVDITAVQIKSETERR
jgi:hypothetical protein